MSVPGPVRWAAAVVAVAAGAVVVLHGESSPRRARQAQAAKPPAARRSAGSRPMLLGHSVLGRPIVATESGDRRAPVALLLVCCVHGNEPAGSAVAQALAARPSAGGPHMFVVHDINPDGVAA